MTVRATYHPDLIFGQDFAVAAWTWRAFRLLPMLVNRAIGICHNGKLVGAALFSNFNGSNVDFSYYAKGAMTRSIIRIFAIVALEDFKARRMTTHVRRESANMLRFHRNIGARQEAILSDYYGPGHDGLQFVLSLQVLTRIANKRA